MFAPNLSSHNTTKQETDWMVRLTHILITASRMIGHHSGELRRMMERFTDEEAIDRSVPFANDVMLVLVAGPGLGTEGDGQRRFTV